VNKVANIVSMYCVKGRHKVSVKDPEITTLRPGRSGVRMRAYKGRCPVHGIEVFKFIGQAGKGVY